MKLLFITFLISVAFAQSELTQLPPKAFFDLGGTPTDFYPLGRCEGDCDFDYECEDGLICFQRENGQDVPGCILPEEGDILAHDWCVLDLNGDGYTELTQIPRKVVKDIGGGADNPTEFYPLGRCEGDCDNDDQCGDGLFCFRRGPNGDVPGDGPEGGDVPGCIVPNGENRIDFDYCVLNLYKKLTQLPQKPTVNLGDTPEAHYPLERCEGDCDNDEQCAAGLICFQKEQDGDVPGCILQTGDEISHDWCVLDLNGEGYTDLDESPEIDTDLDASSDIDTDSDASSEMVQKWNLDNPTALHTVADNKFSMVYSMVSDDLTVTDNMQVTFYDGNCKDPIVSTDQHSLTVGMGITAVLTNDLPVPMDLGTSAGAKVEFLLDTETLANDNKIFEVVTQEMITAGDYPAADLSMGIMELCVRYSLGYYTTDTTGTDIFKEVNFLESILTVKYDLTADFTVDNVAVVPMLKGEETRLKDSYAVLAFMCTPGTANSDSSLAYPDTENISTLNQGDFVQVCVRPDDLALADGVVITSLTKFDWTRDMTGVVGVDDIVQPVIVAGGPSDNGLSSLVCAAGSEYCSFSSILFANFYQSAGTVQGNGEANLEFKVSRRNLKGGEEGHRQLQDVAATSSFDLSVGVAEADEGPGALKTAGGASVGFTALASAVALVSVALLA